MNELIAEIAKCLIADIKEQRWDIIRYNLSSVSTFDKQRCEYELEGKIGYFLSTSENKNPANSPLHYARQLRQAMYDQSPGKGAWFTLVLTVHSTGKFKLDVDYDNKPDFNIDIDEERYVWDVEAFPRDAANTPAWLQEILTKYGK